MIHVERTELLSVNCGLCGKPLKMALEELLNRRTVDCPECEKKLPARVAIAQVQRGLGPAARRPRRVSDQGGP